MQTKLIYLIHKARPKRALFTSFAFSIAWFESVVLPALRAVGCEQIDLLVDARDASVSTEEAASLYAGKTYRIIPIYFAGTAVFHPKLSYFETEHNDCLVVSSANLTLAGHGKNLEVIDAVSSQSEPDVFGEFAHFLDILLSKHEFSAENKEVLVSYQVRAASFAPKEPTPNRKAWLVHTLEHTAAEQLVEHASKLGPILSLTVLSPYHSPSGAPVQRLADKLGAPVIRIGLNAATYVAPFREDAMQFTQPPEYVLPDTERAARFPHAKCFELVTQDNVLVMTGSVNATGQSLESTKNVEVSLVRLSNESPFAWDDVDEPEGYLPCEFSVAEMTARLPALQASWTSSNHLTGFVEPFCDSAQMALAEIWERGTLIASIPDVELLEGAFSIKLRHQYGAQGGLRLVIIAPTWKATGWINVEVELSADETQRALVNASARLLAGEYQISDLNTLLSWLESLHGNREPTHVYAGGGNSPKGDISESSAGPLVTYAEWHVSTERYRGFGIPAALARSSVEALFKWLDRDIEKIEPTIQPTELVPVDKPTVTSLPRLRLLLSERSEFVDDSVDSNVAENADEIFMQCLARLPQALETNPRTAQTPLIVELCGSAQLKFGLYNLEMARASGRPDVSVQNLLEGWLLRFSAFDYNDEHRARLLPYFCALACCTAHVYPGTSLPSLKQALNRLAGRALTRQEVHHSAELAFASNRFARLSALALTLALAKASAIGDSLTVSEQLAQLVAHVVLEPVPDLSAIPATFKEPVAALMQHRRSLNKAFGLVRDTPGSGGFCPCCFAALHADDQARLRTERAHVCKNVTCQRPLFYGVDSSELNQLGLTGRYKG